MSGKKRETELRRRLDSEQDVKHESTTRLLPAKPDSTGDTLPPTCGWYSLFFESRLALPPTKVNRSRWAASVSRSFGSFIREHITLSAQPAGTAV